MKKIFTYNWKFALILFLSLGSNNFYGQNISIVQNNTPVTTNFNGWNGALPSGFTKIGANYVGTAASTTGGLYAVANSGFGYQPSSTSPNNSVTLTGSYINNTGTVITSLKVTYGAFKIVDRSARTPGWAVNVNGSAASGLTWTYNVGSSNTSPDVKTATLTGLSLANGAVFTISFASDRGTGSGSSPMIGLNNIKVESVVTTPPTILNSETFLADFGDVIVGNTSMVESLTFDAEGLINDVTVIAPPGFELSTDNVNWYTGTDVSPVGGILNDVEIYVRFKPTAVGPYSDFITLSSDGATTKTVLVTGNGIPATSLLVTPTSITSLSYPENGGPSQPFQLTGLETVGLIPAQGSIVISPALGNASNYEVSTDGITWGNSATFDYVSSDNTITNPTIYIRIKAGLPEGAVTQETVAITGGGLSTTFTVSGIINPASTITVADSNFGPYCNGTDNNFDVSFTPNGGFISPNYYVQLSDIDGTFPNTQTNIIGTGTASPISVTIPEGTLSGINYRIRVYNDNPLTFSSNDNGHNIIINDEPTLSSIAQESTICANTNATMNLTGLLAGSTFTLDYTIDGGTVQTTPSITADATGNASFEVLLSEENNGQALTVNSIERTDVIPSCTTSLTTGNSIVLAVNPLLAIDSATQADIVCANSNATINLTGLSANGVFVFDYNINNGTTQTTSSITTDALGNASFDLLLSESYNGQTLTLINIERTDSTPSCSNTLTANNTVVLAVNPLSTITSITATNVCGSGEMTTVTINGLLPNSTSDIDYTINSGTAVTLTGITANASGVAIFTLPLAVEDNGTPLEIVSLTRTDVLPNCTIPVSGITATLIVNERPTAIISGDQSICFGTTSSDISIALTGTAPWNLTYTDGTATYTVNNIMASPYTFNASNFNTKTYTLTTLEDAHCSALSSGLTGSATVTINTFSNGGSISGSDTVCGGLNSGTLTLNNANGNVVKWQSSPTIDFNSPTDISNTNNTLVYSNITQTTYYRAIVTNGSCPEASSSVAAITVNTTPGLITQPQSFCNEAVISNLFPNGTGISWYSDSTGTTALSATDALATGDYYATQTINGCESARTLTSVTINSVSAPVTAAQEFCHEGTVADLEPSGAGISWYLDAVGGTALAVTNALATGDYYATQTMNGCESARTLTLVAINAVTAPQGVTTQEITEGGTLADLDVTGTNLNWYQNMTDIDSGTTLTIETVVANNTTYYVTQTVNGCESEPLAITVTVLLGTPEFSGVSFQYYPNPVEDVLHINCSQTIDTVRVYNVFGQLVMNSLGNQNSLNLDISNLASGTYLVNVASGKSVKAFKVIKK